MFNKIIIAALAFAITANGIRTTNACLPPGAGCNIERQNCCNGYCIQNHICDDGTCNYWTECR